METTFILRHLNYKNITLLKKVLNEKKPKLLTESKTYSAYSTIFKYNNAEYQREIAETCLD